MIERNAPLAILTLFSFLISCCQQPEQSNSSANTDSTHNEHVVATDSFEYLFNRGTVLFKQKNMDSANWYFKKAVAVKEKQTPTDTSLITFCLSVGSLFFDEMKYDLADQYLEKGLLLAATPGVDPSKINELYLQSVAVKTQLMNLNSALLFSDLLVKQLKESNAASEKMARAMYQRGAIYYYSKKYEESVDYYKQALTLFAGNRDWQARTYLNLSSSYFFGKKQNEALRVLDSALSIFSNLYGVRSEQVAKVYTQKSGVVLQMGKKEEALDLLYRNLAIRRTVSGEKHSTTFGALYSIATLFEGYREYDSALHYTQKALVALVGHFDSENFADNPSPGMTENNLNVIRGLIAKGRILEQMGYRDANPTYLTNSLKTYLLADRVFSTYKRINASTDAQLKQLEEQYIPYDKMLNICWTLNTTYRSDSILNTALYILEQSRVPLLQNSLQRAEVYAQAGIPESLRKEEDELNRQLTVLLRELSDAEINSAKSDSLKKDVLKVEQQFARWKEKMRLGNPNYLSLKYSDNRSIAKELADFLTDQNSALLEYKMADEFIYVFYSDGVKTTLSRIEKEPDLTNFLRRYQKSIQSPSDSTWNLSSFRTFCSSAYALYEKLVAPYYDTKAGKRLIISPDEELSALPFESFLTEPPALSEVDYRLPYLIAHTSISYTYSVRLLLDQMKKERMGTKVLAFGFSGDSLRTGYGINSDLPGTELEVAAIRSLRDTDENLFFLKDEATEENFKKYSESYDILHLAIHGEADTLGGLESKLMFRSGGGKEEDGQLYAHELYGLNLAQVDLTILSACESGIGKKQRGEGIMSIARGFMFAGCPSLILSLWKIEDRKSATIMQYFYEEVLQSRRIDQALAVGKRKYISEANEYNSHPRYWAPLLPVGAAAPLEFKYSFNYWLIALVAAALVLLFAFAKRQKKMVNAIWK